MSRLRLSFLFVVLAGCAASGGRAPIEELETKQEALEGAPCASDDECDGGEYCDRLLCIPERPCPDAGVCRAVTRFYDNDGAAIPDADPAGVAREIVLDRAPASVAALHVSVSIDHTYRGDLRVVLRSPSGTEHVLHDRTGGSADDLHLGADVGPTFEGEPVNGAWTLVVSDHAARDVGRILTWSLDFAYGLPLVDPPAPGADVWASIEVTVESAHPYANDTDETWDLRLYSAGADRARLRFARLEVEAGYDAVEVIDMDTGAVLDRFSGRFAAFTTREYHTGNLGVRLASDYSVTAYGFVVEAIEVFGMGCLVDDDCPSGTQCPTELIRCIRFPCFAQCVVESPGGEGDHCNTPSDCDEGLYCAGDHTCRGHGTCGAVSDCDSPDNEWAHVLCVGAATCEANRCGWDCGAPTECVAGETMNDGCNDCVCGEEGYWVCTRRYCPPVAGPGEACGGDVVCSEGNVCDQGPTEGPTCTSDQPGTCGPDATLRLCAAVYAPVCACTGQTFSNDCHRMGVAAWAHAGECALDRAIPDADPNGVTARVDVLQPSGAHVADVSVRIDHTWRGDLVVWVEAPDGSRHVLSNRAGGSADDLDYRGTIDLGAGSAIGTWTLHVSDRASYDTGVLRFFNVLAR